MVVLLQEVEACSEYLRGCMMDTFPLHMILFGLAVLVLEPFCYGCAGFILSYRLTMSIHAKLIVIGITVVCFLWMDDIWPALGNRSVRIGVASTNQEFSQLLSEQPSLGQAQYNTGEKANLFEIFKIDFWDLASPCIFIPLAYFLGLKITKRKWDESDISLSKPPIISANLNIPPPPK